MCGRFSLRLDRAALQSAFPDFSFPEPLSARYNIAPSQAVAVVANNDRREVRHFQWGLLPSWAKDPKIAYRMINARAETLAEKPAFRAAYRRRRCLILADGFYEWRKEPGSKLKTPYYIHMADERPFAFAGLWELWRPDDTPVFSCTIITTTPNELVAPIHDRMPVILPQPAYALWLDPQERPASAFAGLLRPCPADDLRAYPVARLVNKPQNDSPECVQPLN